MEVVIKESLIEDSDWFYYFVNERIKRKERENLVFNLFYLSEFCVNGTKIHSISNFPSEELSDLFE